MVQQVAIINNLYSINDCYISTILNILLCIPVSGDWVIVIPALMPPYEKEKKWVEI